MELRSAAREGAFVLAEAQGSIPDIELSRIGGKGTLRMSLQVHEDREGHRSRLGYYGELYLRLPGPKEHHIGYIASWRLSRLYGDDPNTGPAWIEEWLKGQVDEDEKDELRRALESLFHKTGQLKEDAGKYNKPVSDQLQDAGSPIIFIPMIWISAKVRISI